jgi:hypothetical protein
MIDTLGQIDAVIEQHTREIQRLQVARSVILELANPNRVKGAVIEAKNRNQGITIQRIAPPPPQLAAPLAKITLRRLHALLQTFAGERIRETGEHPLPAPTERQGLRRLCRPSHVLPHVELRLADRGTGNQATRSSGTNRPARGLVSRKEFAMTTIPTEPAPSPKPGPIPDLPPDVPQPPIEEPDPDLPEEVPNPTPGPKEFPPTMR